MDLHFRGHRRAQESQSTMDVCRPCAASLRRLRESVKFSPLLTSLFFGFSAPFRFLSLVQVFVSVCREMGVGVWCVGHSAIIVHPSFWLSTLQLVRDLLSVCVPSSSPRVGDISSITLDQTSTFAWLFDPMALKNSVTVSRAHLPCMVFPCRLLCVCACACGPVFVLRVCPCVPCCVAALRGPFGAFHLLPLVGGCGVGPSGPGCVCLFVAVFPKSVSWFFSGTLARHTWGSECRVLATRN